jgi:hypothetical protein
MFNKTKKRKKALSIGVFELSQNFRQSLKAIKKQIELNLPASTYIHSVNYLQAKVEEVIEILYKAL